MTIGFPVNGKKPSQDDLIFLLFLKMNEFYNRIKNLQITASTVSQKHGEDRAELKRHPRRIREACWFVVLTALQEITS